MSEIKDNEMIKCAVKAILDKKGMDVKAMFVGEVTAITDYFVLASCSNISQLDAMRDGVEEAMKLAGYTLRQREGKAVGGWILLDYTDMVIHLFTEEMREFYGLDNSWRDAVAESFA